MRRIQAKPAEMIQGDDYIFDETSHDKGIWPCHLMMSFYTGAKGSGFAAQKSRKLLCSEPLVRNKLTSASPSLRFLPSFSLTPVVQSVPSPMFRRPRSRPPGSPT